jgi:membrane protein implicated in regulation of membrane protease activity
MLPEREIRRLWRVIIAIIAIMIVWFGFVPALYVLKRFFFPNTPTIYLIAAAAPFFAIILLILMILWRRMKPRPPGHCQNCGYDLTGNVSGRCPECGEPVP